MLGTPYETNKLTKGKYLKRKISQPAYNPHPFTVKDVKGTQSIAQQGYTIKTRNIGKVKLVRERQVMLKHSPNNELTEIEDSDAQDWLNLLDTDCVNNEGEAPETDEQQSDHQLY